MKSRVEVWCHKRWSSGKHWDSRAKLKEANYYSSPKWHYLILWVQQAVQQFWSLSAPVHRRFGAFVAKGLQVWAFFSQQSVLDCIILSCNFLPRQISLLRCTLVSNHLPTRLDQTMSRCVWPKIKRAESVSITFDLWMSRTLLDTHLHLLLASSTEIYWKPYHITVGIF